MFYLKRNFLMFSQKCAIYCTLLSQIIDNWTYTRYFCRCFVGFLVATVLWFLLRLNFQFSVEIEIVALAIIVALVGKDGSKSLKIIVLYLMYDIIFSIVIGFLFTSSIRCISFLILMGMAGKSGRGYLRALSFAYIITGK